MKLLLAVPLLLLAIPRRGQIEVHYHPFSWTSQGRIRKDAIAAKDPIRGQYYNVSSLFEGRFDELEKAATAPGTPCNGTMEDYRLYLRTPKGREVWVSVEGCRIAKDYPDVDGTRLSSEDLDDLKRLMTFSMPPNESFLPKR